ncbi:MAG: glycerol-3-phosphate responsive antiterminator [Clostridia bacterium]|nr:glycerol-3-phosphate responsive antiterminator [Clostridia bacterium]NCC42623.1 glycerol-3-phosphate responsive antiterminator [Clostridia bacterium]
MHKMMEDIEVCPIIAAVKDDEGLKACLDSESNIIFVLYGDICTIGDIVKKIKGSNKKAVVHMDLIQGLSSKEVAVDFLKKNTMADGVITTRPALIRKAKEEGFFTVLRFFVIDSMAYENIQKQSAAVSPDVIEILPGLMPKVIRKIQKSVRRPVIAGGLISEKEDIMAALDAGAVAISTTNKAVWFM